MENAFSCFSFDRQWREKGPESIGWGNVGTALRVKSSGVRTGTELFGANCLKVP